MSNSCQKALNETKYFIMLKGPILNEGIISIYAANNTAATFIKKTLQDMQREINTLIIEDFNVSHSMQDTSKGQKTFLTEIPQIFPKFMRNFSHKS